MTNANPLAFPNIANNGSAVHLFNGLINRCWQIQVQLLIFLCITVYVIRIFKVNITVLFYLLQFLELLLMVKQLLKLIF